MQTIIKIIEDHRFFKVLDSHLINKGIKPGDYIQAKQIDYSQLQNDKVYIIEFTPDEKINNVLGIYEKFRLIKLGGTYINTEDVFRIWEILNLSINHK